MFNLTKSERKAFLFLALIYFIGLSVSFLSKQIEPKKVAVFFNEDLEKIDLNTADKEILMRIPGIGEKLSERIIASRRKLGEFSSLEELKGIKGISVNKFNKIKEHLTIK